MFFWFLVAALLSEFQDDGEQRQAASMVRFRLREQIVAEARERARTRHDVTCVTGSCVLDTLALIEIAGRYGIRLVPQAGSAYWERMPPHLDDGVSPTHFGYEWEPNSPTTREALSRAMLPEMHVWAGNPETQEIVDTTTGQFPEQCRKLIGADWPGVLPPDFVWRPISQLPSGTIYRPDRQATEIAVHYMRQALAGRARS